MNDITPHRRSRARELESQRREVFLELLREHALDEQAALPEEGTLDIHQDHHHWRSTVTLNTSQGALPVVFSVMFMPHTPRAFWSQMKDASVSEP